MSERRKIRAYGISASSVRQSFADITGVEPGKSQAIFTQETGRIYTESEVYSGGGGAGGGSGYCDCNCSGGDGEGLLIAIVVIAVLMIMVTIVWAVVMLAFSILTIGGFLKRRYRTVVVVETMNREFLGKLAISIMRKGGVLEHHFGIPDYDEWARHLFELHVRLKRIRQVSLLFGVIWGWIEVLFKLNEFIVGYVTNYDLWPLRIIMVAIFLPMLLYSPILEMQFNNAKTDGEEIVMRLLLDEPSFSPEHRMSFREPPSAVAGISTDAIKKIDYEDP